MQIFLRYAAVTDRLPNRFMTCAYDARMLYILSGEGKLMLTDRVEPFAANTLLYYPPGTPYLPLPSPAYPPRFVTLNFDFYGLCRNRTQVLSPVAVEKFDPARAINSHLECGHELFESSFALRHAGDLRESFLEIAEEYGCMTVAAQETAEALLQYLCCRLAAHERRETDKVYDRLLAYISTNYAGIHDNAELAKKFCYHPQYLNQLFRKKSGKPLHQYIRDLRLRRAAGLLRDTEQSIAEIAEMSGFKNPDHFSRCFSEKYGVSPRRFRKEKIQI